MISASQIDTSSDFTPRVDCEERVLQVFTFYDVYLREFYLRNPALIYAPYTDQLSALYKDGFGLFHIYPPYLQSSDMSATWVIANCEPLQKRWAFENKVPYRAETWARDILRAQVEHFQPTIWYSLNPIDFDSSFIRSLKQRPRLVVGWRAAEIPQQVDWREYDLILSHLSVCQKIALERGAKASRYFHPGVPDLDFSAETESAGKFDVVFTGQWTAQHSSRNRSLTVLAEAAARREFSLGLYLCSHGQPLPPVVKQYDMGARWGRDMYAALRSGKIVVNAEIDLANGEAGNLRLFESTSVGSLLLTQHQTNITRYFTPGVHIETYRDTAELLEKIRFLCAHPAKMKEIADAGRKHVMDTFGMRKSAKELKDIFIEASRKLKGPTMNTTHVTPDYAINEALKCLRNSDAGGALKIIEGVAGLEKPVRDLRHVKAICLIKLSRHEDALGELRREVTDFPDNNDAGLLLADLEQDLGKKPAMTAKVSSASSAPVIAQGQDLNALAQKLQVLLRESKGVEALRISDQLLQLAPQVQGVHYLRGLCLNLVGRHEEALVVFEKELTINPTHEDSRIQYESLARALKKITPPALYPEQRPYSSKIDPATLKSIQNATHNYTYRGVPMIKNPFDFALYPKLLWDIKPRTIIEIGSKNGGSALWFGDTMDNFGIDCHIHSIDIVKVTDVSHPRVTFHEGDGRQLGQTITAEWINKLPRPLLVIEDADHSYETSSAALKFFHPFMKGEEYIVIEDGIISDLSQDPNCNSGPHRAIKEFIAAHPGEYDMDSNYSDFFGYNFTWCSNGFLKRKKFEVNPAISKPAITRFMTDDPVPSGLESQMSTNERFQLYTAIRDYLPRTQPKLRFAEIGCYAGASLMLEHIAASRDGRDVEAFAIEPDGMPSFYEVLAKTKAEHYKEFSHPAAAKFAARIKQDGILPEFIMVDGDHTYPGVRQDILDYYDLLAPGGLMIFHDFLPALDANNKEAIFFHHGGKEPGIRQACLELMEQKYGAQVIDIPLLYPLDTTQTQPHLPEIPGVKSTLRIYRKR